MRRLACMVIVAGLVLWGCDYLSAPPDGSSGSGTDGSGGNGGAGNHYSGINSADAVGEHVPEVGEPVSVVIINHTSIAADVHVRFLVGDFEVRRTDLRVPAGLTTDAIGPDLAARIEINGLFVTGEATPKVTWLLVKNFVASDVLQYVLDGPDGTAGTCPDGSSKSTTGVCGCDVPDTDSDGDGTPDCIDGCKNDSNKTAPGACECGKPETDSDGDGTPDCKDGCANDPNKTAPGSCGCGKAEGTCGGGGGGGGPPPTEACCLNDGCSEIEPSQCSSMGGVPQGPGTICDTTDCTLPLGVLVVKSDAPSDGDGESWETAFQSLQAALDKASPSYGLTAVTTVWNEIWVAQGTYKPDDGSGVRMSSFQLRPGVRVYGGFAGNENKRSLRNIDEYPTILSGDIGQVEDDTDNSLHVVRADEGVTQADALDGFIIEAGNASGSEDSGVGAGVWTSICSPGLNNLVIRNCKAADAGGGMYIGGGNPHLVHCVFESNWAGQQGGGLAITNSSFEGSFLNGCRFTGNQAGLQGGALYAYWCSFTVARCVFGTNQAGYQGGAVVNDGCSLHMVNCQFVGNTAVASDSIGGAIYNTGDYPLLEMMNCRLSGNSAGMGGGLYQYGVQYGLNSGLADQGSALMQYEGSGLIVLVNSTLHRNASLMPEQGGGAIYNAAGSVEATNCIVWDNLGGIGQADDANAIYTMGEGSNVFLTYSCAPGFWGQIPTNTAMDPQFVDPDGPDNVLGNWDDVLIPTAGYPILNGGSYEAILPDFGDLNSDGNYGEKTPLDLANQPRVVGSTVDMGAFERQPQ